MLLMEEKMYNEAFREKNAESVMKSLFSMCNERIVKLVRIIRKVSSECEVDSELINNYKDRLRYMNGKYNKLQTEFSELKIEYEDKADMLE